MKKIIKVLVVGQLPKEVGGTYTMGICNVVYELSKCFSSLIELTVYATNISDGKAKQIKGNSIYRGTIYRPFHALLNALFHPTETIKRLRYFHTKTALGIFRNELYFDNIQRVIHEVQPDIIHCMNGNQMAPLFFSNSYNIPTILTCHGIFNEMKMFVKNQLALTDYSTGLTPETMHVIENLEFPKSHAFMVPNGVDTSKFFFSESDRINVRKQMFVDEETTLLITVASLQPRKGQFDFLVRANRFPAGFKYKYLILGIGPDEYRLKDYIKNHNLEDRVTVVGYVANTELYKYYSAADVYVHPSYQEGQALSEIEAYTCDLKIAVNKQIQGTIVTDTSIAKDYFIFDFEAFDFDGFVQWAKEHKINRITRRQYDWGEIYKRYVSVYNFVKKNKK